MQYLYVDENMEVNLVSEELFNETKPQPNEDYGAYIRLRIVDGTVVPEQLIDCEWAPVL